MPNNFSQATSFNVVARLSEARTSASQIYTLSEQSASEVSRAREVQKIDGIPKTSIFSILYVVLNLYPYEVAITSPTLTK